MGISLGPLQGFCIGFKEQPKENGRGNEYGTCHIERKLKGHGSRKITRKDRRNALRKRPNTCVNP